LVKAEIERDDQPREELEKDLTAFQEEESASEFIVINSHKMGI
jgi:hypothetical protein